MSLSSLFGGDRESVESESAPRLTMANAPMGTRLDGLGRYKMPLLHGEAGTKGGTWVPRGVKSATNLAGALTDPRALAVWERERAQVGLALEPSLAENLVYEINRARAEDHVDTSFPALDKSDERWPAQNALRATLSQIHDDARRAGGALEAARQGTNRHDVWETRARTGALTGTIAINRQIEAIEALLREHALVRVPGLQERVVRNVSLSAAGRFDDILMSERTGRLYMADLKTKKRAFFSWLEVWIQMAVYATAEWMLEGEEYIPGPKHHVSQEIGVVLHMPADGSAPALKRADIRQGFEWALLAREVSDARSQASSVGTLAAAEWSEEL